MVKHIEQGRGVNCVAALLVTHARRSPRNLPLHDEFLGSHYPTGGRWQ